MIVAISSAPPPVITPQKGLSAVRANEGGYHATVEQRPPEAGWNNWWGEPLLVFTFFLMLATILLGGATLALWQSTKKLWLAGEKQLVHGEDTAKRQLRAYVGLKSYEIEGTAVGEHPKVTLLFQNAGQTPAHDVTCRYGVGVDHFPQPQLAGAANLPEAKSVAVLLPGATMKQSLVGTGPVLRQVEIDAINAGTAAIYCFGVVKYRDIFGEPQQTDFSLMMGGDLGGYPDNLRVTETGNTAT